MASNAYKTQANASDKAIAELLIAGFSGQLKGWWDYHLTPTQHLEILNAIQTTEEGIPIHEEIENPIPNAVTSLIHTICLQFIEFTQACTLQSLSMHFLLSKINQGKCDILPA